MSLANPLLQQSRQSPGEKADLENPAGSNPSLPTSCGVRVAQLSLLLLGLGCFGVAILAHVPRRAAAASLAAPARQYEKVQYLGFNLFTAPGTEADGCFGRSEEELESCYLGSATAEEDLLKRQKIMQTAIENAFKSQHWDRNPKTLKVFLAPEFYWRGPRGAYRIKPGVNKLARSVVSSIIEFLGHKRFTDWLFVLGTVVAAQEADVKYVELLKDPLANVSYYNFAPIHVGGTNRSLMHFKHLISSIDFLQTEPWSPRVRAVRAPPGLSQRFCQKHPESNGCVYGRIPKDVLEDFGFGKHEVLQGDAFWHGGLLIGLEICLDHADGKLAHSLGPDRTVDLQLVVSAGMNIASGPVCTARGGPTFLADGFAHTEISLNQYGHGRELVHLPNHDRHYDVGLVYGSDAVVALQAWISGAIDSFTGTGFGARVPGDGTLPGGSSFNGPTGIRFRQISALGDAWMEMISGFYVTSSYLEAERMYALLNKTAAKLEKSGDLPFANYVEEADEVKICPTIDIYGPFKLGADR